MTEPFQTDLVRGILHKPADPNGDALLLTHGAGSNCGSPLLVALADDFSAAGYLVLRYDLPFRQSPSKGPLNAAAQERDREGVMRAIKAVRGMVPGRVVAGGHSYGGRMTATAASEHPDAASSLLLLSYPLHPPEKPQQLRTAFFAELRTPALFVHGSRDPFGSIEELRAAIRLIPARTGVLEVERAGHELKGAGRMGGAIRERMLF